MTRLNTHLESEGAEFLVLGQLLIEGILASKMYTNQRDYDLVATCPTYKRAATIQVKSRWATNAKQFPIRDVQSDFVVFVRLNRGYRFSAKANASLPPTDPEYFVVNAAAAKSMIVTTKTGWGKIPYKKNIFEPYRAKWNSIREFLKNPPDLPSEAKPKRARSESLNHLLRKTKA